MAVKRMHLRNPRDYDYARKREVETLARIRHVSETLELSL